MAKKNDNTIWYVAGGAALLLLLIQKKKAAAVIPSAAPITATISPVDNGSGLMDTLKSGVSDLIDLFKGSNTAQAQPVIPAVYTGSSNNTYYLEVQPAAEFDSGVKQDVPGINDQDGYLSGLDDEEEY